MSWDIEMLEQVSNMLKSKADCIPTAVKHWRLLPCNNLSRRGRMMRRRGWGGRKRPRPLPYRPPVRWGEETEPLGKGDHSGGSTCAPHSSPSYPIHDVAKTHLTFPLSGHKRQVAEKEKKKLTSRGTATNCKTGEIREYAVLCRYNNVLRPRYYLYVSWLQCGTAERGKGTGNII